MIWGLLAGASFALLFIALNRAGGGSGPWPLVASQFTALAVVVCLGAATGEARLPARHAAGLAALTGVTGAAGEGLYFYATHAGLLAVTAVLTSLYPALRSVSPASSKASGSPCPGWPGSAWLPRPSGSSPQPGPVDPAGDADCLRWPSLVAIRPSAG